MTAAADLLRALGVPITMPAPVGVPREQMGLGQCDVARPAIASGEKARLRLVPGTPSGETSGETS